MTGFDFLFNPVLKTYHESSKCSGIYLCKKTKNVIVSNINGSDCNVHIHTYSGVKGRTPDALETSPQYREYQYFEGTVFFLEVTVIRQIVMG